jgi:hypothetical protein
MLGATKKWEEFLMRILIAAALAASLFTTNLFAGETVGPLAPGKAAGVKQAQETDHTILWIALGGVALAGVLAMASNGKGSTSAAAPAAAVTTTTSSASISTTTST